MLASEGPEVNFAASDWRILATDGTRIKTESFHLSVFHPWLKFPLALA
jgi:hypothetical protein